MAEIFLSYASQDRDRIRPLVAALEADGFDVWWDRNIQPGPSFDREIEQAIAASRCVVVAWSVHAVESEWVRSEVEEGARRGILVPLRLDDTLPPLAYRRRQTADLTHWDGYASGEPDDAYEKLVAAIRSTLARDGGDVPLASSANPGGARRRRRRTFASIRIGVLCLAAFCIGALVAGPAGFVGPWSGTTDQGGTVTRRFSIPLPDGWGPIATRSHPLTITPDGRHIVLNAQRNDEPAYLLRPLESLETTVIAQGAGSSGVYAAPDGEWILYSDLGTQRLRRFRLSDGESEPVAALPDHNVAGGEWHESGRIVIGHRERGVAEYDPLTGEARALTTPESGIWHIHPKLFDGGKKLLYVEVPAGGGSTDGMLRVLDLESGDDRPLFAGNQPIVTASGHLVFAHEGYAWATAFDPTRGTAYGDRVSLFGLAEPAAPLWPRTHFAVSREGTLVYLRTDEAMAGSELGWLDMNGAFEPLALPLDRMILPRLDPLGERVAFTETTSDARYHVWLVELDRLRSSRLTFDGASLDANWSADGRRIFFSRRSKEGVDSEDLDLFARNADGTGEAERLTSTGHVIGNAPVPDGSAVVFEYCPERRDACALWRVPLSEESGPAPLLEGDEHRSEPSVSPDGRWLTYVGHGGDRPQVYVRPYANPEGGRWQVSVNGGRSPLWGRGGERLYFVDPATETLMYVEFEGEGAFSNTVPRALVDLSGYQHISNPRGARNFDIDPSGERILIPRARTDRSSLVVVTNWFAELERLAPTRH